MERPIAKIPEDEPQPGVEESDDLDVALGPSEQHLKHEPPMD